MNVSMGIGAVVLILYSTILTYALMKSRRRAEDAEFEIARLRARVATLDRWCSYEFPIVEMICSWMEGKDHGRKIDAFRDHLRVTFPQFRQRKSLTQQFKVTLPPGAKR